MCRKERSDSLNQLCELFLLFSGHKEGPERGKAAPLVAGHDRVSKLEDVMKNTSPRAVSVELFSPCLSVQLPKVLLDLLEIGQQPTGRVLKLVVAVLDPRGIERRDDSLSQLGHFEIDCGATAFQFGDTLVGIRRGSEHKFPQDVEDLEEAGLRADELAGRELPHPLNGTLRIRCQVVPCFIGAGDVVLAEYSVVRPLVEQALRARHEALLT